MFTTIKAKEVSLNQEEILGQNLFLYVEKNWEDKIIALIKDKSHQVWEIKDENGLTILHKSCFLNNTNLSKTIIWETKKRLGYTSAFTAFINSRTDEGLTPLHYTAYKGNLELSKNLLLNGADVMAVTNLGKNIIHLSAEGNQPTYMIYYLSKKVIGISTQDDNQSTPLHWACYAGAEDSVKFLIGLNAEVNAMDKNELTPLHLAVLHNRKNIVIKLLQYGAIKDITNTRGETPKFIAWKKKYKDIFNILNKKEFYPLWSLEMPYVYIEPSDVYKKYIIIMLVLQEFFIILMILPFLRDTYDIVFNNVLFVIEIGLFVLLIKKDPGYTKKEFKKREAKDSLAPYRYPLMDYIERKDDIRNYCPKCFVLTQKGIKHCLICKICVEGFSHHCFWINKCIGKKNLIIYTCFICVTIAYALDSIYICLLSLFEFDYLTYEKFIYTSLIKTIKERQIRVFFASLIGTFSLFASFPLFFLLFNELFKYYDKLTCFKKCQCEKKKKVEYTNKNLELETKSLILGEEEEDEINIGNPDPNALGINRETTIVTDDKKVHMNINADVDDDDEDMIFSQNTHNQIINISTTPNMNDKVDNLFDNASDDDED